MKLTELRPRLLSATPGEPTEFGQWVGSKGNWHEIAFLCPRCQAHEISVAFWAGRNAHVEVGKTEAGEPVIIPMWHQEGDQYDNLTLTLSIDREGKGDKCGGWHGYITNGEIT